jgi:hypothetical protein
MRHVIKIRSKQLVLSELLLFFVLFFTIMFFFAQLLFILYLYALFTGIYPFGRINCVNLSLEDIKGVIRDRKSKDK